MAYAEVYRDLESGRFAHHGDAWDRHDRRVGPHADCQPIVASLATIADARRQPRFKVEVDITITSRNVPLLRSRTVDISESGLPC
jgi:hypothetical protein